VQCESKIRHQTGVARFLCGLLVHILKTGVERFLCGLMKHIYIYQNTGMFVKLIFKTFTLENSKKKGTNILPRFGIRSLCLLFWLDHLAETVFSFRNKLPDTSAKKTKRFNLIQK
jgi:hypothetical protein